VYAFSAKDGRTLWQTTAPAGINACPSVAGDTLFVAAGVPKRGQPGYLIAYRLGA
jgi:outer membrane protein assembly factor BamB